MGMSRVRWVSCMLIACVGSFGTAVAQEIPVLRPGARELMSLELIPGVHHFRWIVPDGPGGGDSTVAVGWEREQRVLRDGASVILLTTGGEGGGRSFGDSLYVREDTLEPIAETMSAAPVRMRFEYAGPRVRWTIAQPDSADRTASSTEETTFFAFNELTLVIRRLPLRRGFRAILPLYSEGAQTLEMDTIQVLDRTTDGAWDVRFADPAIVANYRIRESDRALVGFERVLRSTGGLLRRVEGTAKDP